jgi:two-component system LytT family response regulator
MKIKAIQIEDELPARKTLKSYLKKYFPEITLDGEFGEMSEALKYLKANDVQIIFLDVQLKDGLGIDLLEKIDSSLYRIIFTTAFEKYAMDAFRHKAFGYLLKPLDPDDFQEIISRALTDIKLNTSKDKVRLPIANGNVWIDINQIVRCESSSNYTRIYCEDRSYIISKTLKFVENELLNSTQFIRCHHSHLINLKYLFRHEIKHNCIELTNGESVPVSRAKRSELIEKFN